MFIEDKLRQIISVWLACLALFSFGLGSAYAAQAGKHTSLALSLDANNRMHVYLTISGERTVGVIDTAATFPLIHARSLKAPAQVQPNQQVNVLGINGSRLFDVIEVESLIAGNQTLGPFLAARNDRSDFPGPPNILPASHLKGRVLDFNFPESRLDIYNAPPARPRFHTTSQFDYVAYDRLPFINVEINGVTGKALIDTGSDTSYINTAFADAAGLSTLPNSEIQLSGADGHTLNIRSVTVRRFRLGRFRYRKFDMLAADTELFTHLGFAKTPIMVLGLDVLGQYRMQMDRNARQLRLLRPKNRYLRTQIMPSRIHRGIKSSMQ